MTGFALLFVDFAVLFRSGQSVPMTSKRMRRPSFMGGPRLNVILLNISAQQGVEGRFRAGSIRKGPFGRFGPAICPVARPGAGCRADEIERGDAA